MSGVHIFMAFQYIMHQDHKSLLFTVHGWAPWQSHDQDLPTRPQKISEIFQIWVFVIIQPPGFPWNVGPIWKDFLKRKTTVITVPVWGDVTCRCICYPRHPNTSCGGALGMFLGPSTFSGGGPGCLGFFWVLGAAWRGLPILELNKTMLLCCEQLQTYIPNGGIHLLQHVWQRIRIKLQ